ncbi:MAG: 4Fe-4S binding protein [Armatimonadota bacterium]|nr:MAG: 4Fe-4S binding protein [Armatimonadota bacterium]
MAEPTDIAQYHDFDHCPLCERFRARRRFDVLPWLAGTAVLSLLAVIVIRALWPGSPRWLGPLVPWAYWASVIVFGVWVIRRWKNTYFRWRTVSVMTVQTVIGIIMAGPLALGFGMPLLARRVHLTWPLHMSVLNPNRPESILVYGAIMSFIVWPAVALVLGKRYCSWFCFCGNLAETAGEAFRTIGPKGPRAQGLDRTFYAILVAAGIVTLGVWFKVTWPFKWYEWIVGFVLVDLVGIGLYPILGNRPWCRFFCPLAAGLGALSQHGRFAIYTDDQRCIECGTCNRYCEMGIDIRMRARQGIPLKDDQCVGCGACIAVCPRYALSFRQFPEPEHAAAVKNTYRFRRPFVRQLAAPRQREA